VIIRKDIIRNGVVGVMFAQELPVDVLAIKKRK